MDRTFAILGEVDTEVLVVLWKSEPAGAGDRLFIQFLSQSRQVAPVFHNHEFRRAIPTSRYSNGVTLAEMACGAKRMGRVALHRNQDTVSSPAVMPEFPLGNCGRFVVK